MRISLMMKPHDGDAWIKRVLDVPTKPRTRIPPLSEKDKKWSHVGKFSLAAVIKHRELRKLTPQRLEERERLIEEKRKKLQISRDYSFLFTEEENAERAKIKTQTQRTKCYFRSDNTNRKFGSGSQDLKHNGDRCDKVQDFKANTQKASQQSVHHVNQSRFHNHNGHNGKVQDLNNNNGGKVQDFKANSQKGSQQSVVHHVNQTHYHYGDRKMVQDWNHRYKVDGRRGSQEYIHPVKQSYNNYSENKKVQDWDRNYKVDTQRVLNERGHHRIHRMPYGTSFNYRQDLGYTRNTFRYYPEDSAGMARINRKETSNRWESENRQRKRKRKREVQESLHKPRLTHCY